jgi:hypothetical protein
VRLKETQRTRPGIYSNIQQPLIQTVVDELFGRGKCPSTALTAARTSKVMDTALAAFYGGRDDAFWTRRQIEARVAFRCSRYGFQLIRA